jgi:hypothetical protein
MVDLARERLSECAGKSPFATKAQAIKAIRRRRHDGPLQAYRCRFCGKYHVGTPAFEKGKR